MDNRAPQKRFPLINLIVSTVVRTSLALGHVASARIIKECFFSPDDLFHSFASAVGEVGGTFANRTNFQICFPKTKPRQVTVGGLYWLIWGLYFFKCPPSFIPLNLADSIQIADYVIPDLLHGRIGFFFQ